MSYVVNGVELETDPEGYLLEADFSEEVVKVIAAADGIELTQKHWDVINYLQSEFKKDSPLSIRKIGKSGVVDIKEFYQLFPTGPLKTASKIAGIPKPASCI